MFPRAIVTGFIAILFCASAASADDWKVEKSSGGALIFKQGVWTQLSQGDIVSDDSRIRTLADGSLQLTRDKETISLAKDTQAQIIDRVGSRYTTVREQTGTVGIQANVENVKHFEVRTPFMAAVVKGTIFGVHTDDAGSAVAVQRGTVMVVDDAHHTQTDVHQGQSAKVSPAHGVNLGAADAADPDIAAANTAALQTADASQTSSNTRGPDAAKTASPMSAPTANSLAASAPDAHQGAASARADIEVQLAAAPEISNNAASRATVANPAVGEEKAAFGASAARNAAAIMKSVISDVTGIHGYSALVFWPALFVLFFLLGLALKMVLKDMAFGLVVKSIIWVSAPTLGLFARVSAFDDPHYILYDPILTLALVIVSAIVFILAASVARRRSF